MKKIVLVLAACLMAAGEISAQQLTGRDIIQKVKDRPDGNTRYGEMELTLKKKNGYSLVEYKLETGRKNQIRVHSADMGHPVCGDTKYGNGDDPCGRLALHAYVLCFEHPITRERMEFVSPIPGSFKKVFER